MEVETKYIAPRSDAFVALMQAPELAGFHLEPLPPAHLRDVYLDTAAADLLRLGYAFRIREQDGDVVATIKSLGGADGALHRRLELEAALGGPLEDGRLPHVPDGPLREALDGLVGDAPLRELTRLRQYRTPRVAFDGARLVGVLSLDVVAHEAPSGLHVSNEVEVELADSGREEDLFRLDPVLRARGLEPAPRSKFERALLRLNRDPDAPLLLLPDERAALDRYAEDGTPLLRRRARVVLLAAQGLRSATIANKVGLSATRVRHWVEAFRGGRMGIFEGGPDRDSTLLDRRPALGYRVSELVTGGAPLPPLFRSEHFLSDGLVLGDDPRPEARPAAPRIAEALPEAVVPPEAWAGGDGEHEVPALTREESLEVERVPAEPPAFASSGDGASTPPPQPDLAAEAPARGDAAPVYEAPEAVSETVTARPDDPPEEAVAAGAPPPRAPSVPEDVASLDELLDLFEGAPVATPHLDPDVEPVGMSLVEEAVPVVLAPGFADAPREAEGDGHRAAGFEQAGRSATPAARTPSRPVLHADEPVLDAAVRVLAHARDYLVGATARLAAERDAAAVRRVLVAAHRVRIALELFDAYLPPRSARRLHRGLRPVARALDALGDLDLVRAHVAAARDDASAEARAAFGPVLDALDAEREVALTGVAAHLGGAAHVQWLDRYERLLARLRAQAEAGLGDDYREAPDDYLDEAPERPARDRLRHMLGSALWDRYEALRAYDAVARAGDEAAEELLYPLGVACAALQYVLGLASGCADDTVKPASRALADVERHLIVLHHARRAERALGPLAYTPPVLSLRRRLRALADAARAEVPSRWATVAGEPFREALARVVVAIGAE